MCTRHQRQQPLWTFKPPSKLRNWRSWSATPHTISDTACQRQACCPIAAAHWRESGRLVHCVRVSRSGTITRKTTRRSGALIALYTISAQRRLRLAARGPARRTHKLRTRFPHELRGVSQEVWSLSHEVVSGRNGGLLDEGDLCGVLGDALFGSPSPVNTS